MRVGLRVDVDTLRGTRRGVPALCRALDRHGAVATFYLSVGPDNMGRHLWRLLRPAFLAKMMRTRAASLYGWDILLRGTVLPGPRIGDRAAAELRDLGASGNEIGFHAWDHHAWQSRIEHLNQLQIAPLLRRGIETVERLTGAAVRSTAAPAWRVTDAALHSKRGFDLDFNSDCRGHSPFLPLLDDGSTGQLQIPTTLPTFDERVGLGVDGAGYYDEVLAALDAADFAVLTVHAEVEGIVTLALFERFLERAGRAGHRFVPLGELAAATAGAPAQRMERRVLAGREGWMSAQPAGTTGASHEPTKRPDGRHPSPAAGAAGTEARAALAAAGERR